MQHFPSFRAVNTGEKYGFPFARVVRGGGIEPPSVAEVIGDALPGPRYSRFGRILPGRPDP